MTYATKPCLALTFFILGMLIPTVIFAGTCLIFGVILQVFMEVPNDIRYIRTGAAARKVLDQFDNCIELEANLLFQGVSKEIGG